MKPLFNHLHHVPSKKPFTARERYTLSDTLYNKLFLKNGFIYKKKFNFQGVFIT